MIEVLAHPVGPDGGTIFFHEQDRSLFLLEI